MDPHMLDFDPADLHAPGSHYIAGAPVAEREPLIAVARPSDGAPFGAIPDATAETVDRAVRAADLAFRASGWAARPPRERAKALARWADLIAADDAILGRLEAACSTRPIAEVLAVDLIYAADCLRFFAEYADKLCGDVVPTATGLAGSIRHEPYGVIGAIVPWNFPISMAIWKLGPALATGNAIVLKPSELTPFSAVRLAELAIMAGIPPGLVNVVQGRGPGAGQAIVAHALVGKVSFTGSLAAGRAIMETAARIGPKPVTLELGGKSPQLVFADARDLGALARTIARGFLTNAGQVCVAGSRLIVQRSIEDELVSRIVEEAGRYRPGPTWKGTTTLSPIVSARQADRIDALVQATIAAGAEAVTGGARFDVSCGGAFYRPTILRRVTPDMPGCREEIFGPVLTVQVFEDEAEGLDLADHPDYGLAAAVHTEDFRRAMRVTAALQAGTIWVNRYGRTADHILPTGGYKKSGIGKDIGREALDGCTRRKSVLMDWS